MLENNILATVITLAAALLWLRVNDFAAHKGWMNSQLSRKIIHMGTGPIFVLCWLLFDSSPNSRYFSALVPLLISVQFTLVGLGIMKDDAAVQAMSRTGDPKEILRGPLYYGLIFVVITVLYWLDSPIGIVALMLLCGGDGLADILGRRWGKAKLPWSKDKSWVGSLGMLTGGLLFAIGIVYIFNSANIFSGKLSDYFLPIVIISLVATIIESIPVRDIDNITITTSALILGHYLF
ncbi:MAG: phosphatidate cytidylyltransferase [Chloroflexi bacterium]|jgi:phytol kinase|nr:phosphatidate cytidylyltransferase [Chloroflexota bacterium]MBT3669483.1 phosphatidate cytidylyltransferase [Chloroflexota bacterium]MBT4003411.1 phosphatidate cytidylyltransferase [Chloroflexota bacterium]MBT4304498.1 phosphatidate cytidylyltransferase [Chloroflexota bacterium]MBT4534161.1 phosphatidate cytidylyltransferase [Chloroflexota bacterium]